LQLQRPGLLAAFIQNLGSENCLIFRHLIKEFKVISLNNELAYLADFEGADFIELPLFWVSCFLLPILSLFPLNKLFRKSLSEPTSISLHAIWILETKSLM
jgi:hypothetical protein